VSNPGVDELDNIGGLLRFQLRPQLLSQGKTSTRVARTDLLSITMQVVASGGETNRHAHTGEDAMWLVLSGRARFYGATDNDVVELGKDDGLVIRSGAPYWFESASEESLVILRVGGLSQEGRARVDYGERKARPEAVVESA
jgi:mannose-6-phosphate isomerase-like protein (cupin superfamily)